MAALVQDLRLVVRVLRGAKTWTLDWRVFGFLAGVSIRRRAANMNPIDALRE